MSDNKSGSNRFIGHFDCDCFEVQIARLNDPVIENHNKPCIVTHCKSITSVSYEARTFGISRNSTIEEAYELCPGLHEYPTQEKWNKIDRSKCNKIAKEIQDVVKEAIGSKSIPFEIIGNDEFYLDFTKQVKAQIEETNFDEVLKQLKIWNQKFMIYLETDFGRLAGNELIKYLDNILEHNRTEVLGLVLSAFLGKEIIDQVQLHTSMILSAGFSSNKLRAKICGALNKPASITILPDFGLSQMSKRVKLNDIPGLKGTLGKQIQSTLIEVENMFDLSLVPEAELISSNFTPSSIRRIKTLSNGICHSPVVEKNFISNQMSFSKSLESFNIQDEHSFFTILRNLCQGFLERVNQEIRELSHRKPGKAHVTIGLGKGNAITIPIFPEIWMTMEHADVSGEELYNWIYEKLGSEFHDQFYPFTTVVNVNFRITKFL